MRASSAPWDGRGHGPTVASCWPQRDGLSKNQEFVPLIQKCLKKCRQGSEMLTHGNEEMSPVLEASWLSPPLQMPVTIPCPPPQTAGLPCSTDLGAFPLLVGSHRPLPRPQQARAHPALLRWLSSQLHKLVCASAGGRKPEGRTGWSLCVLGVGSGLRYAEQDLALGPPGNLGHLQAEGPQAGDLPPPPPYWAFRPGQDRGAPSLPALPSSRPLSSENDQGGSEGTVQLK